MSTLDPIAIATKGQWCDTGPWDISISTHGYICEVTVVPDQNALKVYMGPIEPLEFCAVPVEALIADAPTDHEIAGLEETLEMLAQLSPFIGPQIDTILVDPDVIEQIRSGATVFASEPDPEKEIGPEQNVKVDGDDTEEF